MVVHCLHKSCSFPGVEFKPFPGMGLFISFCAYSTVLSHLPFRFFQAGLNAVPIIVHVGSKVKRSTSACGLPARQRLVTSK